MVDSRKKARISEHQPENIYEMEQDRLHRPVLNCLELFTSHLNLSRMQKKFQSNLGEKVLYLFKPCMRDSPVLRRLISHGLGSDALVWLKMPPATANTGQSLACCRKVVATVLDKGPTVYKIGVTGDPLLRFYKEPCTAPPNPGYYKSHEKFKRMYVLYAGATWEEAALMEAVLIESHLGKPGNRNIRPGGEGRRMGQGPFFTYLVFKSLI